MCCFLVPLTQAAATSAVRKITKNHSDNSVWLQNLPSLEKMLWGGSVMLIIDHIINGELMWRFPFFTALETEGGAGVMLREVATTGVAMSAAVTLLWVAFVLYRRFRPAKA